MSSSLLFTSRLKKFCKLARSGRALVAEAVFFLTVSQVRLAVAGRSGRRPTFGRLTATTSDEQLGVVQQRRVAAVARAVVVAARSVPWDAACLVQAMAAKGMLKRRGIDSTLYLGVRNDPEQGALAHAWLCVGTLVVTGDAQRPHFTAVARFT